MNIYSATFDFQSKGPGLTEITTRIANWVNKQEVDQGLLTVFCRHTSASLIIQENADPDVCHDLESFFRRIVPEDDHLYLHRSEGPDDMPAHIRAALTQTSLSVPVSGGNMVLGTWQGIYLFEHRRQPHQRQIFLQLMSSD